MNVLRKPMTVEVQVQTERCTGHCCEQFHLPFSIAELRKRHLKPRDRQIPGMLVLLYRSWSLPSGEAVTPESHPHMVPRDGGAPYIYTCKNFKEGSCSVYETRPDMCRNYPDDEPCRYKDCTRKTKPVTIYNLGLPDNARSLQPLVKAVAEYMPAHAERVAEYLWIMDRNNKDEGHEWDTIPE